MANDRISDLPAHVGALLKSLLLEIENDPAGTPESQKITLDQLNQAISGQAVGIVMSDESTALTTGTAKVTMRMPFAFKLVEVRATLTTVSSSGVVTIDINETGSSILSTKLTVDAGEKTSTTAATAAVISDDTLADDAEMTFDIDTAGTGAAGLKVWLIGYRDIS